MVCLVISYHGDTLLCSLVLRDLCADLDNDNVFYLSGLAEVTVLGWMRAIHKMEVIPVITRNFEDQNDSLLKCLVEELR